MFPHRSPIGLPHMSLVNRAGLVSGVSPRYSFHMCSYERRAGPVTEISAFATEISVTGMKFSDMNTPGCSLKIYASWLRRDHC